MRNTTNLTKSMEVKTEKNKNVSEALMEHLRKNPPRVKSVGEVVNLLHVISAEQRSCNVLRSCVDKVLMNMSNIRTLRDIIERLRSVSRTNGFRFELPTSASPETRCHLVSDMFSVKIVLGTSNTPDHSPIVLDVSIKHKEDYRSSPLLANVIRAGNFLELSNHMKGLMEMYSASGSRQSRTRVYMALQSLETDLMKMSQMYRETHKESSILDITMEGTVGCLTPRLAGDRPHFAYYISPYDLIDTSANCRITLKDNVPRTIGLHAEVSIEQRSSPCCLPISPLISNKHPIDISGMPRFMDISHHNSTSVQASFVLHLKPPVPVLHKIADDIKSVTGLELSSDDNGSRRYLELLNAEKKIYKVLVGDEAHAYHLDLSELKASLVSKVYFSQPGHVIKILDHLRKQAHLNTLISSCVRDPNNISKKGKEWYFEVSCCKDIEKVNVTMEHPSSRGTALLEIKVEKSGFPTCKIFTGRGDPPLCADEFVVKILRKCSSLPITMRKLIEQSIKNPKKELDIKRPRPLFPPPTPQPPTILTPVPKPVLPQLQQQHQQSIPFEASLSGSMPDVFSPVQTQAPNNSASIPKKCVDHPMLTRLLIPTSASPGEMSEPLDQPTKSHPMLLTLLKEDNDQDRPHGGTQRGAKTSHMNHQMGILGGNQQNQFNNQMGFISPNSGYSNMDTQIPIPASQAMPPPSYPSPHHHNQFNQTGQMPSMSPAHVPHSPYPSHRSPMGGLDDMTGPVTPTNPFTMMSPGLMSPGAPNMQNIQRGKKFSRQKSHSTDNHNEFSGFDMSQYESQMSMESDSSVSELLGFQSMQNRTGLMTPLRRSDSISSDTSIAPHLPLRHTTSLKPISESSLNPSLLTRSASVSSGKSMRSIASPVPRNLRTPDGMMMLGSPPVFDATNANQRGLRVKSYDSDFFRSPLPSASSGGMNLPLSGGGLMHDQDSDPFTFDDNKNPSKISMPDMMTSSPGPRGSKPSLVHSSSLDNDDTLRELAKTKPVLLRALTGDANTIKSEAQNSMQRQLGGMSSSGFMVNLSSGATTGATSSTATSGFDFSNRLMTLTTISTIGDKNLVRQNAVDKAGSSAAQQAKSGEIKGDKTAKKRNSSKNEEGKAPAKKRGRPPSVKDHGAKKKKGDGGTHDDGSSNPTIMLNIQLSSTGAPISSTTKTKPVVGSALPHKNQTGSNLPNSGPAGNGGNTTGAVGGPSASNDFGNDLEKYLNHQKELQKRKELKEKKGIAKALLLKQSFGGQSSNSGSITPGEKPQLGIQVGKVGTSPRNIPILPGARKRKSSIKDVVDRLHSKIPDVAPSNVTGSSSPDNAKRLADKDANSSLLSKTKSLLQSPPYQKISPGSSMLAKALTNVDEKSTKAPLGQKSAKIGPPKIGQMPIVGKQGGFTPVGPPKGARLSTDMLPDSNPGIMDQVLRQITEAAAATTKRNTVAAPLNKPTSVKVSRPGQPVKARSITPTMVVAPGMNPGQRISPSSQMMKNLLSDLTGRPLPLKMASNQGGTTQPTVKKSPIRNQSIGGLQSRPNSVASMDAPSATINKPSGTSATTPSLTRKSTMQQSGDQHFVAPSISPTPKRTSSPQIQRTTSPLTRIDDKVKGLSGRSPSRPSPTHSRIATPVPASSPSPDDRLVIDDPAMISPSIQIASLSRDDQRPVFLSGSRYSERQSPERTVMPSPLSPPSLGQKNSSGLMQSSKRAPTPRNIIASPGLSPVSTSSPFLIDDDLMNQAVTG